MDKKPLAVILARGGSKRLPGKNIREFDGKPLIARTIETVSATKIFSQILVSTDSPEIAEVSRKAGAWIPFQRPPELASDDAASTDALIHAVLRAQEVNKNFTSSYLALFQVTSPFLTPEHIREADDIFRKNQFQTLSSVCLIEERPEWLLKKTGKDTGVPVKIKSFFKPGKKLPELFIENGAMYFVNVTFLLKENSLYDFNKHGIFLMTRESSLDIDTAFDWDFAEFLAKKNRTGTVTSQ